jgi:hypothetical protein
LALDPKVPPTAVKVVDAPLQISEPVTLVGAAEGWLTVIVFVNPEVVTGHGAVPFWI